MVTQKSREHLCSWIRVEQLFSNANDDAIDKSLQPVLDLFTSNKELLHFIVKHTSKQRLDLIYEILKKENEQQKLAQKKAQTTKATKGASSNFDKISKESISNICGFLNRDDIELFKDTSRRISVICLEEMGKYAIGICNALQIMNDNINDIRDIQWFSYMSYDRYYNTTKYETLFAKMYKKYDIPIKCQIPINIDWNKATFDFIGDASSKIGANQSIIMFDKREITILKHNTHYQMSEDDIFDPEFDTLIALYQFNINKQQIEYVTYIKN